MILYVKSRRRKNIPHHYHHHHHHHHHHSTPSSLQNVGANRIFDFGVAPKANEKKTKKSQITNLVNKGA